MMQNCSGTEESKINLNANEMRLYVTIKRERKLYLFSLEFFAKLK
jgi:hypothetical protein